MRSPVPRALMTALATPPDPPDFASFFRIHFAPTVRSVESVAGGAAEDVAQDAFIVALERWKEVAHLEAPDAWVRLVARRMAWRRRGRELDRGNREMAASRPDDAHFDAHPTVDLERAIGVLPRHERAAVRLYYIADLPISRVAEILGCTEAAAKIWLFRGRERLGEALIGHRGRWVSERRWRPDDVVKRMRATRDDAFVDVVLDEVPVRDSRWTLTMDGGAYRIETDEGQQLDRGRYRMRSGALSLTPWNGSGRIVLRPDIDGGRARFRLMEDTTAPTRGVPDEVFIRLLLESGSFAWLDPRAPADRTT